MYGTDISSYNEVNLVSRSKVKNIGDDLCFDRVLISVSGGYILFGLFLIKHIIYL